MALVLADRVQETTNTTGTGTLTLAGAVTGYQSFNTAIGNGNTCYYTITNGTDWEVGVGTFTSSGTTLSRDTVFSSSAAGAKIAVTTGSVVFSGYPAYAATPVNITGYATTATAAGTTVLTATSTFQQFFTGTNTQSVTLPVSSTLQLGWTYWITNNSTGNITVNSSGGNLVNTVLPQTTVMFTCIDITVTTAAGWDSGYMEFGTVLGGGGSVPLVQQWYLSSAGGALTGATQNYFGANSAASLDAASTYDIECYCYFLKTTSGTMQWIPTFSSAITAGHSYLEYTPVTGFTTTVITGAMVVAEATQQTTTVITHTATAALTTAVYHVAKLKIRIITNLASNFRLNGTISAGSITPQAGSWYTARKINSNSGNFVA